MLSNKEISRQIEINQQVTSNDIVKQGILSNEGASSIVYKGYYSKEKKNTFSVAIKYFNKNTKDLMVAECKMINEIYQHQDNPNFNYIIGYYGYGYADDLKCQMIVMELAIPLKTYLITHTWPATYSILLESAKGLSFLHGYDIIYCDFKKDNILIVEYNNENQKQFQVKLCDFGLSVFASDAEKFKSHEPLGTPIFFAPELLNYYARNRDKNGHYFNTKKSDMYSFGIFCWNICTRKDIYLDLKKTEKLQEFICGGNRANQPQIRQGKEKMSRFISSLWQDHPEDRLTADEAVIELSTDLNTISKNLAARPLMFGVKK